MLELQCPRSIAKTCQFFFDTIASPMLSCGLCYYQSVSACSFFSTVSSKWDRCFQVFLLYIKLYLAPFSSRLLLLFYLSETCLNLTLATRGGKRRMHSHNSTLLSRLGAHLGGCRSTSKSHLRAFLRFLPYHLLYFISPDNGCHFLIYISSSGSGRGRREYQSRNLTFQS